MTKEKLMNDNYVMNREEMMSYLRIKATTFNKLVHDTNKSFRLPAVKVGREWRCPVYKLKRWLDFLGENAVV